MNLKYKKLLILCSIVLYSCDNNNKWKVAPMEFERKKSYAYSEMISGELDSVSKSQHNAYKRKKINAKQNIEEETESKNINSNENNNTFINTIKNIFINIYKYLINIIE
tara:strand:+ start:218 stop:544 length:327 start_codon:yes stop_codon:yes gene_type:complete